MNATHLIVLLIIGIILVSGCISYKQGQTAQQVQQQQEQAQTPTQTETQKQEPAKTTEAKKFTVEGNEFSFSPSEIRVNKGDVVEITFKNVGVVGHNLWIENYEKHTQTINRGKEEVLKFTADEIGTFAIYCAVPGHRAAGMEGKLIVT